MAVQVCAGNGAPLYCIDSRGVFDKTPLYYKFLKQEMLEKRRAVKFRKLLRFLGLKE